MKGLLTFIFIPIIYEGINILINYFCKSYWIKCDKYISIKHIREYFILLLIDYFMEFIFLIMIYNIIGEWIFNIIIYNGTTFCSISVMIIYGIMDIGYRFCLLADDIVYDNLHVIVSFICFMVFCMIQYIITYKNLDIIINNIK